MSGPTAATLASAPPRAPRAVGTIERIPKWLNLIPMVIQWAWLGLKYRSLTLPSSINPRITAGGLVGDSKAEYFTCMGPLARAAVAEFVMVRGGDDCTTVIAVMEHAGLAFPVVAKPDLGWCGFGVRKLSDVNEMDVYLRGYPAGAALMIQRYLDEPGEAGIFYVRAPDQPRGHLLGILLRHYPRVVGDGRRSMAQLIAADPRLRRTVSDPLHRCDYVADVVPAAGLTVRLSLIGSTRVGGRYEDGSALATARLLARIEAIARDMPQFHVGRFDVRYRSLGELRRGRFTIMEVNGAGSEAVHAWDPKNSLRQVYRIVFAKQRMLFAIGATMRTRGHAPIGAFALLRLHWQQQRLIRRYPASN